MAEPRGPISIDANDMADRTSRTPVTVHETVGDGGGAVTATRARTRVAPELGSRRDADPEREIEIPQALNLTQDRVRWGPIVAGLCTAITSLLILSLLGLAFGLTVVNAGSATAQGGAPEGLGRNSAIWGAISGLIAFGLGGWVAGRTAAVFGREWGALNGALVFLVAVPVILWLASMGLGTVLGSLGNFAGSLNADPGTAQQAAQGAADQARQNVQPVDVARAAEGVRNTAWGTLLGMILGLGASALGGMLGTRRELERDRRTGRISD